MFDAAQKDALQAPLSRSHVKTRSQAGRELSYVESWFAISEANRIFGFDGWDRETVAMVKLGEPYDKDGKWYVSFMAQVKITVRADMTTVVRIGSGYGSGVSKNIGDAYESALKEAESDAAKRALMTFGNPFGLALYDKAQNGVVDDAPKDTAGSETKAATPGPDPKQAAAVAWAEDAIPYIRKISDGKSFDAWHKENRERVARIKNYDPNLHQRLLDAVSAKLDAFNPIGV